MKRNQVTIAMLIFVAAELNTLLFAGDKEIPEDKTVGEDVIIAKIKEAAEQLVAEDTLTPKTTEIMKALEIVAGPIKPEMKVNKDEEIPEETGEPTLLSQVEDAVELKELRLLVKNESEFESLRKTLNSHKEVESLREAMLSIINVPATDGAEEKVEKKDEKKEVPAKGGKKEKTEKVEGGTDKWAKYKVGSKDVQLIPEIEAYWKKNYGKKTDKGILVVESILIANPTWHIDLVYSVVTKSAKTGK